MTEVQTFKEYAKNEKLFDRCVKADNFQKYLKRISKKQQFKGLITLPVILSLNSICNYESEGKPVNNFNKLLEKYGNWRINDVEVESSYSHGAPVETDVYLNIIQLADPKNDRNLIDVVEFYGENSDFKDTSSFLCVFPSDLDDSALIDGYMLNSYAIADGYFKFNGKKYYFDLSVEGFDDTYKINIMDAEKLDDIQNDHYFNEYIDGLETDATNKTQLLNDISDLMSDYLNTKDKKATDLSINYFCECQF